MGRPRAVKRDRLELVMRCKRPHLRHDSGREAMQRFLIIAGIVLVALGLLWPFIQRIGLGRLPGDIVIERPGFSFYFPIVTSIVISVVLSLLLWLLNR